MKFSKNTTIYRSIRQWSRDRKLKRKLREWEKGNRSTPPPHLFKQRTLREFAQRNGLELFIETGTYRGDMIEALKDSFEKLYSIELSQELYEKAVERFEADKHIEIIQGDSGKELEGIMKKINRPTLFWLDGHYSAGSTARGSKETPIFEELDHIISSQNFEHIILIDDAHCFGNNPGYPSIDELKNYIASKNTSIQVEVEFDSIRLVPSPR